TIRSFEDMESWKKARRLSKALGEMIINGRFGRSFRLINQMEGSVGSIMDNISEGFERGTRAEFIQFLGYAKGSCGELRSQLYRAYDWRLLDEDEFVKLKTEVILISAMLQSLITYLQQTNVSGTRRR
ncbi:MAG: four helix bundle protein, partial [Bacteroidota bacterium]|nr:four helix bundle protein [Bacteroidota bacterium]